MPKVVLAAVDDTPDSEAAVAWLAAFLPPQDELRLVMCISEREAAYSGHAPPQLEAAKSACKARFPSQVVEVVVVPTSSSEAIGAALLERAQALRAAMLAIAPHVRASAERVLRGSVTDYVCRHSHMPVMVVQGVGGGRVG